MTAIKTVGAAFLAIEKDGGAIVKGVFFGCRNGKANSISFSVEERAFGSQVLRTLGIAIPICDLCRVFLGFLGGDDKGRMLSVCGSGDSEFHFFQKDLVSINCLDGNCFTRHNKGGSLSGSICKGYAACGAFPACKILAVGSLACRNGNRFTAACFVQVCSAVYNGDRVGNIAINCLDANVACGHYKGSGGCCCIDEYNVFAADNDPTLECLAVLGSVCGNSDCNTATNLGNGGFVNSCIAVFYLKVKC